MLQYLAHDTYHCLSRATENHDIFSATAGVVKTLQSYFLVFSGHVYFAAGGISDMQNLSVILLIAFQWVMTCILCFFFLAKGSMIHESKLVCA